VREQISCLGEGGIEKGENRADAPFLKIHSNEEEVKKRGGRNERSEEGSASAARSSVKKSSR